MMKNNSKFGLGIAVGILTGVLAARKLPVFSKMPNIKTWQRILSQSRGDLDAAFFMARVQKRYFELRSNRPVFDNAALNFHVILNLLPGLALYQVLREDGMGKESAVSEIEQVFEAWLEQAPPLNLRLNQLMAYTPENFAVFQRLVQFTMDYLFPSPGWDYEVVERSEIAFAFYIHSCFYLKVLDYYDAPELTPVFCKLDDILMGAMPSSIHWGRTNTIGMGADCCDFRWDYVPAEKIQEV